MPWGRWAVIISIERNVLDGIFPRLLNILSNNRSLGQKLGGYFFCIAGKQPVATINNTIVTISLILMHPLSGERYRRRISPAQDVSYIYISFISLKYKHIFAFEHIVFKGLFISPTA